MVTSIGKSDISLLTGHLLSLVQHVYQLVMIISILHCINCNDEHPSGVIGLLIFSGETTVCILYPATTPCLLFKSLASLSVILILSNLLSAANRSMAVLTSVRNT